MSVFGQLRDLDKLQRELNAAKADREHAPVVVEKRTLGDCSVWVRWSTGEWECRFPGYDVPSSVPRHIGHGAIPIKRAVGTNIVPRLRAGNDQ